MAKLSAIQRNLKRIKLEKKYQQKRKKFKDIVNNRKLPLEERFKAQLMLAKLPKNSSKHIFGYFTDTFVFKICHLHLNFS